MRIFSVTPIHVGDEELARRQARYAELLPDGVTLDLVDIGPQAPAALNSEADVRASEEAVGAALRCAPAGYDWLMPDCVLDPGVADLRHQLPVVGIFQLSLGWQVVRDRRVGAVVRNQVIGDELRARAEAYGWSEHLGQIRTLDLGIEAVSDHSQWDAALDEALDSVGGGAVGGVVINGCSAVPVESHRAMEVVDPAALALRLLAAGGAR